jgi:hypothetical protein
MADRREAACSSTSVAEAGIRGGLTGCPSWCTRRTGTYTSRPKLQRPRGIFSMVASMILHAWESGTLTPCPPGTHRTSRSRTAATGTPSHPGEMEAMRLGAPPVQECAYQLVVTPKARPTLRRAQSGPHEVPINQTR